MAFPHLFSSIRIGAHEVKNRIVSTGHMACMLRDGLPSDDMIAYHAARAAGGVGLIVTEAGAVHPSVAAQHLATHRDDCVAPLGRLAEAIHEHDCRVFGQLGHGGRRHTGSDDGTRPVTLAPSVVGDERFHNMPRALTGAEIAEIVAGFGAAAARYEAAGYDGVEILASHHALAAQFLNPRLNRRDDAYGGGFDNRLRFLREAIAEVRARLRGTTVVGLRISGDEMSHDGLTAEEVIEACAALDADRSLDYLSVTAGAMSGLAGSVHVVPPMFLDPGYVAPLASAIRARVSVPVMVAGRINQPQIAEAILKGGQADLCGMTRALICDPEMPLKAAVGRLDDIRACIGCNQACIGHMQKGYPISCIQHPETGRERAFGAPAPASRRRRVLVAGGGPAGMKAAAVAGARGHEVILCERAPRLGGQALLAQALPRREEFGGIIANLAREVEAAGVDVRTGAEVTAALVARLAPDAVILATGAAPRPVAIEGAEEGHVVEACQVLSGRARTGARVVIADGRCDWIGLGLAEKLVREGCHVRLAVNGAAAGELLQMYLRDHWVGTLHGLGVEIITYARPFGVDAKTAYFAHTTSGEPILLEDVDTLVLALGHAPRSTLEHALAGFEGALFPIGDCLAPRTCEEAVLEGLEAGSRV